MSAPRHPFDLRQWVEKSFVAGNVTLIRDVGGDVTFTADRLPYRLKPWPAALPVLTTEEARAQPSRLLQPRYAVVPLVGRTELLNSLREWMSSDETMAVRLLHAAGGHGKTRIAVELASEVVAGGGTVLRADHDPAAVSGAAGAAAVPDGGRLLVVVDYADRWPVSHLLALLGRLSAFSTTKSAAVRVLLLGRSAQHWWPHLCDRFASEHGVESRAIALPPLAELREPLPLFTAARHHFAERLRVDGVDDLAPLGGLSHEQQILAIHMAALASVDAHRHETPTLTEFRDVAPYLLRREYTHWSAADHLTTSASVMQRVAYVATLTGPQPRQRAQKLLKRAGLASSPAAADQIIDDHRRCHPPADLATVLEPLRPDRLGEDLVALMTPGRAVSQSDAWLIDDWIAGDGDRGGVAGVLLRGTKPWTSAVITTLVEVTHRWPHVGERILYPLLRDRPDLALAAGSATLTRLTAIEDVDQGVLEAVEVALPESHVELDLGAAAVVEALTHRRLATETDPGRRAAIKLELSSRLHNIGRYEEARALAEEAVEAYDRLAKEDQQASSWVRLVNAMTSLAADELSTGQWERALRTSVHARTVCNALMSHVEGLTSGMRPFLATILSSLSLSLAELGQHDESLAMAEYEVGIQRRLVAEEGTRHLPRLAGSLDSLAARLALKRRWDEAVETSKESLEILRALARIDPVRHRPSLARSLTNVTAHLSKAGRYPESLAFAQEAMDIHRQLASVNPGRFQSALATSVTNFGSQLLHDGRPEIAADFLSEGVILYRELMAVNPEVHTSDAAVALYSLALAQAEAGQCERALAIVDEVIELRRRRCGQGRPEAGDLAAALNTRGRLLARLHRRSEAIKAIQEGIALLGPPDAPGSPDLASTLCLMASLLIEAARPAEALAAIEEAVRYWEELDRVDTGRHRQELAASLVFQAGVLLLLLRPFDALPRARHAIELLRSEALPASSATQQALASALWQYARACADMGVDLPQALHALTEVVDYCSRSDDGGLGRLACWTVADVLEELGYEQYADDVRRQLDEAGPNVYTQIALPIPDVPVAAAVSSPDEAPRAAPERASVVLRWFAESSFEALEAAVDSGGPLEAAAANVRLADLLAERGDIADARAALARAESFGGGIALVAMLEDARLCYLQGDRTAAMIKWLAVAATGHGECAPVAEFNLAVLLREQGEIPESIALFRRAVAAGDPDRAPKAAMLLAELLNKTGDLDGEHDALRSALWLRHPEAARAILMFAAHLRNRGESRRAGRVFRTALHSGDPEVSSDAAVRLGQMLEDEGRTEQAVDVYRRAATAGHERMWLYLGALYHRLDDRTAMREAFQHAADSEDHAVAVEGWCKTGMLRHIEGDIEGAKAAYREALARDDGEASAEAAANLGAILLDEGDVPAARELWRRAISTRGTRGAPAAALNLSTLLTEPGESEEKLVCLRIAARSDDPQILPRAAYELGVMLHDRGDTDGACDQWRRAMDSGDNHHGPRAALKLAIELQARGDKLGACAAYRNAAQASDAHAAALASLSLAQLLTELNDVTGATSALARAVELGDKGDSLTAVAHFQRGSLLEESGDLEGARAEYALASQSPDHAVAAMGEFHLALVEYRDGRVEAARESWERVARAEQSEYSPKALVNLGVLLRDNGDPVGACDYFRQAARSGHPDLAPYAALALGELFTELGKLEQAAAQYRWVVESAHPRHAAVAGTRLAELRT